MKQILIIALILLSTVQLQAQAFKYHMTYRVSQDALYGGALFDLGSTLEGESFGLKEANPVLKVTNRATTSAVVIGTTVAVDLATRYLARHGHPTAATRINFAFGGAHGLAGIYNVTRKNK